MHFARFVGTVLAPHHRKNSQLGDIRIASQNFLYARVFVPAYPMLGRYLRRHLDFHAGRRHHSPLHFCLAARQALALAAPASAATLDWNTTNPSPEPTAR